MENKTPGGNRGMVVHLAGELDGPNIPPIPEDNQPIFKRKRQPGRLVRNLIERRRWRPAGGGA
ncbi:MAG: hypothetical protein HQL52_19505 [Magnetococcales bacterium]|nr:hypothetical protein [Magnetococcales bacterium]